MANLDKKAVSSSEEKDVPNLKEAYDVWAEYVESANKKDMTLKQVYDDWAKLGEEEIKSKETLKDIYDIWAKLCEQDVKKESEEAIKKGEESIKPVTENQDATEADINKAEEVAEKAEAEVKEVKTNAIKKIPGYPADRAIDKQVYDDWAGMGEDNKEKQEGEESEHSRDHFDELLDKEDGEAKLWDMYQLLRVTNNEENPSDGQLKKEIEAEIDRLRKLLYGKDGEPKSDEGREDKEESPEDEKPEEGGEESQEEPELKKTEEGIEVPVETAELREQFDEIKDEYKDKDKENKLIMLHNLLSQIDDEAAQEDLRLKGEVLAEIDRLEGAEEDGDDEERPGDEEKGPRHDEGYKETSQPEEGGEESQEEPGHDEGDKETPAEKIDREQQEQSKREKTEISQELLDKFKEFFNISKEDLEKLGFDELSAGQQQVVLNNLYQITLGRIREAGEKEGAAGMKVYETKRKDFILTGQGIKDEFVDTWKHAGTTISNVWKSIWKTKRTKGAEKTESKKLYQGGIKEHESPLKALIDGMKDLGPEVEMVNGEARVKFASEVDFTKRGIEINDSNREIIDAFNKVAHKFANIPDEFALESASFLQKRKFKKLKAKYEEVREVLLIELSRQSDEGQVMVMVNNFDSKIQMSQHLNSHPKAEKEILNTKNQTVWMRWAGDVVSSKGLYMGMGWVGRTAAVGTMGVIGAPLAAMGLGYFRGKKQGLKKLGEQDQTAQKGGSFGKVSSEIYNMKIEQFENQHEKQRLEEKYGEKDFKKWDKKDKKAYLDAVEASEKEFEKLSDEAKYKLAVRDLSVTRNRLYNKNKISQPGEGEKTIYKKPEEWSEEDQKLLREKEEEVAKREKTLAKRGVVKLNYSSLQNLSKKIENLTTLLDSDAKTKKRDGKEVEDNGMVQLEAISEEQKNAYRKSLQVALNLLQDKMDKGLIDYGAGKDGSTIAEQYKLIHILENARMQLNSEKLEGVVKDNFELAIKERDSKSEKKRKKYLRKEIIKGVAIAGAFASVAAWLRGEYGEYVNLKATEEENEWFSERHGARAKAIDAAGKVKAPPATRVPAAVHQPGPPPPPGHPAGPGAVPARMLELATIQKGDGIESAFIRQLTEQPKAFGFDGDVKDAVAVKTWAGGEAHRIAIRNGYVDAKTGQQIRLGSKAIGNVAYRLEAPKAGSDILVNEVNVNEGGHDILESHKAGSDFEGADKDKYEYVWEKPKEKPGLVDKVQAPAESASLTAEEEAVLKAEEVKLAEIDQRMRGVVRGIQEQATAQTDATSHRICEVKWARDRQYYWDGKDGTAGRPFKDLDASQVIGSNTTNEEVFGKSFYGDLDRTEIKIRGRLIEELQRLKTASGLEPRSGETVEQFMNRANTRMLASTDSQYANLMQERLDVEREITSVEQKVARVLGFEHVVDRGLKIPGFVNSDGHQAFFSPSDGETIVGYRNENDTLKIQVYDETPTPGEFREYGVRIDSGKVLITEPDGSQHPVEGLNLEITEKTNMDLSDVFKIKKGQLINNEGNDLGRVVGHSDDFKTVTVTENGSGNRVEYTMDKTGEYKLVEGEASRPEVGASVEASKQVAEILRGVDLSSPNPKLLSQVSRLVDRFHNSEDLIKFIQSEYSDSLLTKQTDSTATGGFQDAFNTIKKPEGVTDKNAIPKASFLIARMIQDQ